MILISYSDTQYISSPVPLVHPELLSIADVLSLGKLPFVLSGFKVSSFTSREKGREGSRFFQKLELQLLQRLAFGVGIL